MNEQQALWLDKLACREIVERSVLHVDSGNADAFSELFADNAVLVKPNGAAIEGRNAIHAAYAQRPAGRITRHLITNAVVDIEADGKATVRSYVLLWSASTLEADPVFGKVADARQLVGEFTDSLTKTASGTWLITRREARFTLQRPA